MQIGGREFMGNYKNCGVYDKCINKMNCSSCLLQTNYVPRFETMSAEVYKGDNVNQPSHYADKQIEVIDYIKDTLSKEEFTGYCTGNVIKYVSRWKKKGGKEDLEKAYTYLGWAIQNENNESKLTKKNEK